VPFLWNCKKGIRSMHETGDEMSKQIKEFTPANVRDRMSEIEEALEPIAEKHGLTLDQKGRTFYRDSLPVMFQLLVKQEDEDGNALDAKAIEFQKRACLVGLQPSDLHREFQHINDVYRITGLNSRAKKYPILAECVRTGKVYKFRAEMVKFALKRSA